MNGTAGDDVRVIAEELVELLGPAQEEMLHRRKLFLLRARAATREALFYLGMLYPTNREAENDAINEYCGFALRQVESLYQRVRLPDNPLDELVPRLTSVSKGPETETGREIQHLQGAIEKWKQIGLAFQKLRAGEALARIDREQGTGATSDQGETGPTLDTAADFREHFEQFLDLSLPQGRLARWVGFRIPDWLRLARKRLAVLIATVLVGFVVLKVEVVTTLLFDHGWVTGLVVLYLAAPTLYWLWSIYSRRKGQEIAFWDVGGRPFRSLRHAALEPDQLMRRWPERKIVAKVDVPAEAARAIVEKEQAFFRDLIEDLRPPRSDGMVKLTHGGVNHRLGWTLVLWIVGLAFCRFGLPRVSPLFGEPTGSTSVATVYAILAILMAVVWVARVIDFWEFVEALPVRRILLTIALVLGVGMWNDLDRWFFILFFGGAAFYWWWYRQNPLRATRRRMVLALIMFGLLNLSGLFTQNRAGWDPERIEEPVPLERVSRDRWPIGGSEGGPVVVLASSGGGSRAAVYTGLTLAKLHGIADIPDVDNDAPADIEAFAEIASGLQAISSVSGGSLANAAYIARRLRGQEIDDLPDALSQDFIGPTLWGFAAPGLNRGDGIEQNWQGFKKGPRDWIHFERYRCGKEPNRTWRPGKGVRLGNLCLSNLANNWTGELPPFPLPLFNTSSLDGHDIVISPLDKALYTNEELEGRAKDRKIEGQPTWVYDRDGIYGLEDLLPDYDPHLSAAVRASANFPFGFPLVEVKSKATLFFSPRREHREAGTPKRVRVTDGGALSNSGMFPLYNLLVNKKVDLRDRGVLLIIVDASKMPTYPDLSEKATNLKGTISDQGPIGQQLHRRMFDHLEAIYADMFAVFQIDLTPDEKKNVLTTWALSKASATTLRRIFNERWNKEKHSLRPKWEHLKTAGRDRQEARRILEELAGPSQRAARYQDLVARLMAGGEGLSGPERQLLQILRDDYLEPSRKELEVKGVSIPLVSHDRPPLD